MIEFTSFITSLIFFIIFPGYCLLKFLLPKIHEYEFFTGGTLIGSLIFLIVTLLVRIINLDFRILFFVYIGIWIFCFFIIKQKQIEIKKIQINIFSLISCLILTCILVSGHITNGLKNGSIHLTSARDGLWHLSVISELMHSFPPHIPGYPSEFLRNYHYYYDLLVASIASLTRIPVINLYERYFSFFSAAIFVAGVYSITARIVKNNIFRVYGTTLVIMAGNISLFLPLFFSRYQFSIRSNLFLSDHPFDQAHNPFNLYAYALFLFAFIFFFYWHKEKTIKTFIPVSMIIFLMPGVKIYAALLLNLTLVITLLYIFLQKKKIIWYTLIPFLGSILTVVSLKGNDFSILSLNPGWLLNKMIEDRDRLFLPSVVTRRDLYIQNNQYFKLAVLNVFLFLIYIAGNLNIRILSLGILFKKIKSTLTHEELIYFLSCIILGFSFPLFFSQKRAVYDSIQFSHYALLMSGFLFIAFLSKVNENFLKRSSYLLKGVMAFICFFILCGTNVVLAYEQLTAEKFTITKPIVDGLHEIKKVVPFEETILTLVDSGTLEMMYISAFSERRVFLSGDSLSQQLGVSTKERYDKLKTILYDPLSITAPQELEEIMEKNHINYFFVEKAKYTLDLKRFSYFQPMYENEEVIIYKRK